MMKTMYLENEVEPYIFELITSNKQIETNVTCTLNGFIVYKQGFKNEITSDYFCKIEDLSTDINIVEKVIDILCKFKVAPVHIKDVVEDLLQAGEL